MKKSAVFDRYLQMNPLAKGNIEISILILTGIISLIFNFARIPLYPVINIAGIFVLLFSLVLHFLCERHHKAAHSNTQDIEKIVTSGIYGRLRHPIYLSLIIMYLAVALMFNSWLVLFFSLIFSVSWGFTAVMEEEILINKFGVEYEAYKRDVRWRIIPGIF
ncbi:isoprenylcysteine carboxylmethyltransferase family protein [Marispirochaeta aestuarii]|uniref:methyltransferase family protein n=1 Tax=Marispirochaeta aestuarii TaxID=1963862 RepID=UPI0029C72FDD|nr:isoprenylcysteine carboxylmethyltransferase family protein [Marispirochaeta aestuarii]